ncbi:MAG: hypothetical protein ABI782_10665, partial [Anaerolineaceae bacterium]
RLAAKLTGWRIDIHSQAAADRAESPASFVPFAPGEEPDIDVIAEVEEVALPIPEPIVTRPLAQTASAEAEASPGDDDDLTFAAAVAQMPVPDRDERESEDYGEERDDDDEEYEVPAAILPEHKPSAIRFGEDLVRQSEADEIAKKAAANKAKAKRAPRFIEETEEDLEEIDYSGRIH